MNITAKIADLAREMVLLEKVVSKKSNPVLQNVLISADDGRLLMSASDIEIELTCQCTAVIEEPGVITLPAKRLLDLLRLQSGGLVTLSSKVGQDAVQFTSGAFKSKLQSLNALDFPLLPDISVGSPTVLNLPRLPLRQALKQVRFVVEEKTTGQYFMQGVKIEVQDGTVIAVSTSSQRLALASFAVSGVPNDELLLPIKAVDELLALLDEDGMGDIQISHNDQHLSFVVGKRHLKSGQISGQFPAYRRVIPSDPTTIVTASRSELIAVLKRHMLIDNAVHMSFGDVVRISSKSAAGESTEEIRIVSEGPDTEMHLRADHLLDFLNAATSPTVTLSLKTKAHPMMAVDGSYLNVILGMNV